MYAGKGLFYNEGIHGGGRFQYITTTRIAGGLLLGYNPNYTCPGLKSFALHFVQVTIAI